MLFFFFFFFFLLLVRFLPRRLSASASASAGHLGTLKTLPFPLKDSTFQSIMSTAPVKSRHQPQQHHPQPPQQQRQHQHQQPHQPLHNFSLPSFLQWPSSNGSSRVRREPHPPRAPHLPASSPKRTDGGGDDGRRMEGDVDPKKEGLDGEGLAEGEDGRKPWNLRPRRAAAAMAAAAAGVRNGEQENRPRRNGEGGDQKKEEEEEEGKKKRRRLWIALTKEEIEEDVFIMTGCRPSRRPKKRSKTEQKHLDVMIDRFASGILHSAFC